MTLPRRLLDDRSTDTFKQGLLRSAGADLPSSRVRANTRIALGLGAGVSTMAATSTAAAATSLGVASVAKLVTIGFVIGLATLGGVSVGVDVIMPSSAAAAATAPSKPMMSKLARPQSAAIAPTDHPSAPEVENPQSRPAEIELPARRPEIAKQRPQAKPVERVLRSERAEQLKVELAVLDEARRALAVGNPNVALDKLERMHRDFPGSALSQEASVVRIEALAKSGARGAAMTEAKRFSEAYPNSPYAMRLQRLLQPTPM
jgi:hypothetical protein